MWELPPARKDNNYVKQTIILKNDSLTIVEGDLMLHYIATDKGLFMRGFQKRDICSVQDKLLTQLEYPFAYGDSIADTYSRKTTYFDTFTIEGEGNCYTVCDGRGVLTDGDGRAFKRYQREGAGAGNGDIAVVVDAQGRVVGCQPAVALQLNRQPVEVVDFNGGIAIPLDVTIIVYRQRLGFRVVGHTERIVRTVLLCHLNTGYPQIEFYGFIGKIAGILGTAVNMCV